jgi:hypothetical protein
MTSLLCCAKLTADDVAYNMSFSLKANSEFLSDLNDPTSPTYSDYEAGVRQMVSFVCTLRQSNVAWNT